MGTEFTLFDNGLKPKSTKDYTQIRNELGIIFYESNLMSNKGPRKMKVNSENNLSFRFHKENQKSMIFDYN